MYGHLPTHGTDAHKRTQVKEEEESDSEDGNSVIDEEVAGEDEDDCEVSERGC